MKKNIFKKFGALFMAALLTIGVATTSFAADSTVTYKGRRTGFEFEPGSYYTETDLFDNFKNVMPGDVRTEKVTIENMYSGCDYIKVSMRAVLHDADGNPISPNVLAELKARKASAADAEDRAMTDIEYMNEFLQQLHLTVTAKNNNKEKTIYSGTPDALETGFENGNVVLGTLRYKKSMTLDVKLKVPIEMDNEFADRIGEVDWVFVIEERNDPSDGGGGGRPSPVGPGEKVEVVEPIEPQAPAILPTLPKTGDNTVVWPYVVLLGFGIVGMFLTLFKKRKHEKE